MTARVVVVGGGVAGLAAAHRVLTALAAGQTPGQERQDRVEVVVLEGSAQVGGKLRLGEVAGVPVDLGAESVLARRPEAVDLLHELGLSDDVVHPEPGGARLWSRGALHPLPAGTLMGVPATGAQVGELLTDDEREALDAGAARPGEPVTEDLPVGAWVAGRVGRAPVDRLVEPLLGGVYAGHADELSLEATVPALWEVARSGAPLGPAVERASGTRQTTLGPVFAGLRGGVGRLPVELTRAVHDLGGTVRTGATARALRRTPSGWEVHVGPASAPEVLAADAVVVAVPPSAAARLLADEVPSAAADLAGIETASVAVVTLALPRTGLLADPQALAGTGFLVPPVERRYAKAATFSTSKWRWSAEAAGSAGAADPAQGLAVVRLSVGRHREVADLQRDDADIVRAVLADLSDALGGPLPQPREALVTRWGGGLPQYLVGHRARVARVRAAVATHPGLAVAGAAYDGLGIAAVVAGAHSAAQQVVTHLSPPRPAPGKMGA